YDAAGNVTMTQDGTGARTYTAYDALGRAVATETPPVQTATTTLSNITYTAYNNLNQAVANGYFQLNAAGTARTSIEQGAYILDANGDRLQSTDGMGNTTTYTYDSQHRVLTSTTPLNETTTYGYDVNGNLIRQTDADGHTQSWTYNYFKQVLTHVDDSGATYTYTYDAGSGLLVKETSNWTANGPSSSVTSTLDFSYDADGALAQLSETVNGVASTYTYGYDANGNETLETDDTYDGTGAAVDTLTVITYDSHNRLQEVTEENAAGTSAIMRTVYVYDADGNRRAVFSRSAYDSQGSAAAPIAATPIPLTTGVPSLTAALSNQTVQPGSAVNYTIPAGTFSDPLGMGLTYTVTGLPSGVSFNASTQTFSGAPPRSAGNYSVTVTATDVLGRSVSSTLTISVPLVAPVFTAGPTSHTVSYNSAFSFTEPGATSPNGLTPVYSASYWNGSAWVALPSWISFNASTLTFSGEPPIGSAGTYTLVVWSSVTGSGAAANQFTLTVPALAAPVFTAGPSNESVTTYQAFGFAQPAATDSQGFAVSYSAGYYNGSAWVGLPSWISFNASTLVFSGTPPIGTSGTLTLAVWATAAGQTTGAGFTLTVNDPAAPTYSGPTTVTFSNNTPTIVYDGAFKGTGLTYSINTSGVKKPSGGDQLGVSVDSSGDLKLTASNTSGKPFGGSVIITATDYQGRTVITTIEVEVNPGGLGNPAQETVVSGATYSTPAATPTPPALTPTPTPTPSSVDTTVLAVTPDLLKPPGGEGGGVSGTGSGSTQVPTPTPTPTPGPAPTPTSGPTPTPTPVPTPTPAPSPTPNVVADWYTYDADGRVLVANGSLQNGQVVFTSALNSGENAYDAAGDLTEYTSINASNQTLSEKAYYDVLGDQTLLQTQTTTGSAFANYELNTYDAQGRQTSQVLYNLPGSTEAGTYNGAVVSFSDAGWVRSDTVYTYNADGDLVDQSEYAETSGQSLVNQYQTASAITSS
ncbi:putative Ig domain-containing protein, partial [Dyella jejuensis]